MFENETILKSVDMKKLHYGLSISTNKAQLLLLECSDLNTELEKLNSTLENITNTIPTSGQRLENSTFLYQIYFPSTSENDEDSLDGQTFLV